MNRNHYFFLVVAILFLYVAARSILVPISHDEAATFFHYVVTENFLPYFAQWDANNHFLNSALVTGLYKLFGSDLIWLRLPNVFAFLVYAYFIKKILGKIEDDRLALIGGIAILSAWMPLEFFAQSRGYGLSLAFLAGAIWNYSRFYESGRPLHQVSIWVFLILSMSANMSLSNTYLLFLGGCLLNFLLKFNERKLKNTVVWVVLGLAPFLAFATYAFDLKSKGLLYYGTGEGFIPVTVGTLLKLNLNTESLALALFVVLVGLVASLYLLLPIKKGFLKQLDLEKFLSILLLGNALGTIALHWIMGVNYPEDRVGMYFIPLFLLALVFGLNKLEKRRPAYAYTSLLLLVFPIITISQANFHEVKVWNNHPLDKRIYEIVNEESSAFERPVIIGGYKMFDLNWSYHNFRNGGVLPSLSARTESEFLCDFQICYDSECDPFYDKGFVRLWRNREDGVSLLKNTRELDFELIDSLSPAPNNYQGNSRYFNLFESSDPNFFAQVAAFDVEFRLSDPNIPINSNLVIAASDAENNTVYYDFIPFKWIRLNWEESSLKMIRPLILPPETQRLVCYIWNLDEVEYEIEVRKFAPLISREH